MKNRRTFLALRLSLFVFIVMSVSAVLVGGVTTLFLYLGIIDIDSRNPFFFIIIMLVISIVIGTALSLIMSKHTFKEIDSFIKALQKVAHGDFSVRVNVKKKGHFKEITDNFNIMVEELSGIETLRDDFVSNFSHEFKTPIVSIRGFAKLLKNPALTAEEREEYLNIIFDESNRLAQLASNTLLLSRLESQELVSEKTTYKIDEQIRECILILEREWSKKEIDLSINLPEITYNGNEDLLKQLFINIISNAVKFTPNGGKIAISAIQTEDNIIASITDSGEGMTEDIKRRIFDKFYQGDTSHATNGNGLGLSIVKRIINIIGGKIKVTSEPNKGSTFTIILPITQ